MMRALRFLRKNPPYNAGEVAGFEDAFAAQLVALGIATHDLSSPEPSNEQTSEERNRSSGRQMRKRPSALAASLPATDQPAADGDDTGDDKAD
jgi:hypothetical protein